MRWLCIWWSVNQPWRISSHSSCCCFQCCPEPDDPFVNHQYWSTQYSGVFGFSLLHQAIFWLSFPGRDYRQQLSHLNLLPTCCLQLFHPAASAGLLTRRLWLPSHLPIWSCYLILSQDYHVHQPASPTFFPAFKDVWLESVFVKSVSVLPFIFIWNVPGTVSLHKSTGSFAKGRGISGHLPEIPEKKGTQYLHYLKIILQILKFNGRSSFIIIIIIIIVMFVILVMFANIYYVYYVYLVSLLIILFYESHYT